MGGGTQSRCIEWEATGIQVPFFAVGLKQINSDSTFLLSFGPLPLPPSRQPIGELTSSCKMSLLGGDETAPRRFCRQVLTCSGGGFGSNEYDEGAELTP